MSRQQGYEPSCSTCDYRCPELLRENEDAWELWALSSTQWRATAFGLIGLDYGAMFKLAEVYQIDVDPGLFAKVKMLEISQLERDHARQRQEVDSHGK